MRNKSATAVVEEDDYELEMQEQRRWEKDLALVRERVESVYGRFTPNQWKMALEAMHGKSALSISKSQDVDRSTVTRLMNSTKFQALLGFFGRAHMNVARYNFLVELRRRAVNVKERRKVSIRDILAVEKAHAALSGLYQHVQVQTPQVQIILHPAGAAQAKENPTLEGMVVEALPAPDDADGDDGDEAAVEEMSGATATADSD